MRWRTSLPARVALVTTGLLAVVMGVILAASYLTTALLLRDGVDQALVAALPASTASVSEILSAARDDDNDDDDHHDRRRVRVLEPSGVVRVGSQSLPVDERMLQMAMREGRVFTSVVQDGKRWRERQGPDWWQALTPHEEEWRVLYAVAGPESEPVVIQSAAPLGLVGEVLPKLVWRLGLVGALGILLAGVIAWRMAARTYHPLQVITATADDISTQTPGLRIPDHWQDQTLHRLIGVLNAMIGRLQESFEAQGRFVAAAAHELRGPLAAMRAELEVALRRARSPVEYRTALEGALAETGQLTQLSEHLLTLARFERGAALAMERDLDLSALVEQAVTEVERTTGGEVVVDAPAGLLIDGDPISLERLVVNLVRNGIQAEGSPVKVALREEQGGLLLIVQDQGRGIQPEALAHLFEPFYRADPARGREGGSGLGLAIVDAVLQAHGGRVTVASTVGAGSTFRVWLPRYQRPALV